MEGLSIFEKYSELVRDECTAYYYSVAKMIADAVEEFGEEYGMIAFSGLMDKLLGDIMNEELTYMELNGCDKE